MRRKRYRSYVILILLLFGCLNLPSAFTESLQAGVVRVSSPLWKQFSSHATSHEEGILARVIYRAPSTWNSSVWVDLGERNDISVNSPVLVDGYLVGIVEMVGKKQSRVRLLTDTSLVVSVRAQRGEMQHREMVKLIDQLGLALSLSTENLLPSDEEKTLAETLSALKSKLEGLGGSRYLAKGELFGTSSSLWRSRSSVLKGVGFNYDFEDGDGPARDLRTGKPYGHFF